MEDSNNNYKYYWWLGAIIILLVAGGTYYYSQKTAGPAVTGNTTTTTNQTQPGLITAKHQFKNGQHIVAGETTLSTICDLLVQDVLIAESAPEQVTLKFSTLNKDPSCLERVIPVRFRFDFTASEQAVIKATWNGMPVELNLIPVAAGENIDNFEVELKG